jgi:hypothetical protein
VAAFELVAAVAGVLGLVGILCLVLGVRSLRRRRPLRFLIDTLAGLLLLVSGALLVTLAVATQGYQALTREVVAARVAVRPTESQRFDAEFRFPDGRQMRFTLAGDQLYVDAHILKWRPLANLVGLHTAYELDRVAGRYANLEQERGATRTIFSLAQEKPLNIFHLRQRYALLAPLLDVEYGSATFTPVTRPASFEVRVSTSGLLIREVPTP